MRPHPTPIARALDSIAFTETEAMRWLRQAGEKLRAHRFTETCPNCGNWPCQDRCDDYLDQENAR